MVSGKPPGEFEVNIHLIKDYGEIEEENFQNFFKCLG